jgi:hypothetical protein
MEMYKTTKSLVIPSTTTSNIPAPIRAPLYFILRRYEIRIAENKETDFGRKIYEGDRIVVWCAVF